MSACCPIPERRWRANGDRSIATGRRAARWSTSAGCCSPPPSPGAPSERVPAVPAGVRAPRCETSRGDQPSSDWRRRGCATSSGRRGVVGAVRGAVAQAWLPIGMAYVGGVFVFFVFGLSLGLVSYFHAAISTLGLLLLLLVLEKLTERAWHDLAPASDRPEGRIG